MVINETINMTVSNITGTAATINVMNYMTSIPDMVSSGNVVAIIISLVLFFVALVIVNAISDLLISFMKRSILFTIVILVLYDITPRFIEYYKMHGMVFNTIIMGFFYIVGGGFALYISGSAFFKSFREHITRLAYKIQNREEDYYEHLRMKQELREQEAAFQHETVKLGQMFSSSSIHNEKSVFTILIYLIVAEFGVFSSPTLSAPNVNVGVMFFLIFLVGIIIFTKSSYKDTKTAVTYFGVTFVVGLILSFTLGVLWGANTIKELFSPLFFTSDSLVAMITGMGVSLFAGSKG